MVTSVDRGWCEAEEVYGVAALQAAIDDLDMHSKRTPAGDP